MGPGSFVILHLQGPTEKFWGVLLELEQLGVLLRGLNVSTFDDWLAQAAGAEPALLGLTTMFVPMSRVERIFLDEQDNLVFDVVVDAPELFTAPDRRRLPFVRSGQIAAREVSFCAEFDRAIDPATGLQRFDLTPPADLPPPPAR